MSHKMRTRVRLVAVTAAASLLVAGCADDGSATSATGETSTTSMTAAPATTTTAVTLADPTRYVPLEGEPAADAKQLAADTVQALTTYRLGVAATDVGDRLVSLGVNPEVATGAVGLLSDDSASTGEIVYPQLGGLTDTQSSVMVVVRQRLLRDGQVRSITRTIDVRLAAVGATWTVTGIASIGGGPPVTPSSVTPVAAEVLASSSIELPDSARWDIQAGLVDDRLLAVLARIATDHTLSVTVLASGHPVNVFDSASVSNHTRGRGVDIWAVDGEPVVAQRDPAGALYRVTAGMLGLGVTELGSPWDLDGPGGAAFTNTVHQDHLHLAFDS